MSTYGILEAFIDDCNKERREARRLANVLFRIQLKLKIKLMRGEGKTKAVETDLTKTAKLVHYQIALSVANVYNLFK
jgi:hypothetical protein